MILLYFNMPICSENYADFDSIILLPICLRFTLFLYDFIKLYLESNHLSMKDLKFSQIVAFFDHEY